MLTLARGSPEIWRNRPYDAKSDMWAAGVILYELCALRPPFRGRDMKELSKRVQSGAFARISPRYSSDLDAVIRRLLRVDPGQRPSAAEALELPQVAARRKQVQDALEGTAGAVRAASPHSPSVPAPPQLPRALTVVSARCAGRCPAAAARHHRRSAQPQPDHQQPPQGVLPGDTAQFARVLACRGAAPAGKAARRRTRGAR